MPSSKKTKTPPKMKILEEKKTWRPRFLECAERHVFRLTKITVFERIFGFLNEEKPYFDCIKADDFRWN